GIAGFILRGMGVAAFPRGCHLDGQEAVMRRALPGIALRCVPVLPGAACTVESPAGTPVPPVSGTLERGPRGTAFGSAGAGASVYCGRDGSPRGVRIGDRNYVSVTGCAPANGRADRVLPLIQESGALERSGDQYPRS